jgi:hypothetical protein
MMHDPQNWARQTPVGVTGVKHGVPYAIRWNPVRRSYWVTIHGYNMGNHPNFRAAEEARDAAIAARTRHTQHARTR